MMLKDKKNYKILHVEDNEGAAFLTRYMLMERINLPEIILAKNFGAAKAILSTIEIPFDIILLDLFLPDMSGEKLITEIIKMAATTPVIIISNMEDISYVITAISLGAADYLLKHEINAASLYKTIALNFEKRNSAIERLVAEKRFNNLFEITPAPTWVYDLHTLKFLDVNETAIKDYGFSKKEFLKMSILDIRPQEDIVKVTNYLQSHVPGNGYLKVGIFNHLKKDGSIFSVEINANRLKYNERDAVIVIALDVTERMAQLKKVEELNDILQELYWKQAHITRSPIVKIRAILNFINAHENLNDISDISRLIKFLMDAADELDKKIIELINQTSDLYIKKDKETRHFLELASENTADMICIFALDGSLKYVAPSALAITGYKADEIVTAGFFDLIHPEDRKQLKKELTISAGEIIQHSVTFRLQLKSGGDKSMQAQLKILLDNDNEQIGFIATIRAFDNKDLKSQHMTILMEERAVNEARSRFISLASHELRTPLALIQTSVALINVILTTKPQEVSRHTEQISDQLDKIVDLMDKLFAIDKIDSNLVTVNKQQLDITALIREILTDVQKAQKDNRLPIFNIVGITRPVKADASLLKNVISNLINNALKYSKDKPAPIIELNYYPDAYQIRIKDFGIGIPENDQKNIFTAFYRATNTADIRGTGLGTYLVKNFTELQGGEVSFISTEGQGTEFILDMV
jgi:PAS domain S-box-containing protein